METKDEIIKNGGKIDLIRKEITSENDAMDLIGESVNFLEDVENQQFTLINNASAFKYDQGHDFTENILDEHIHANFKIPALLVKSLNKKIDFFDFQVYFYLISHLIFFASANISRRICSDFLLGVVNFICKYAFY